MVDNRYATALVIAGVLSLLATVYLSVAVGTQPWYQYSSPAVRGEANASELRALYEEFMDGEFDEKTYCDTLFRLNGTVGLWWRCVLVPAGPHWHKDTGTVTHLDRLRLAGTRMRTANFVPASLKKTNKISIYIYYGCLSLSSSLLLLLCTNSLIFESKSI